MTPINNIVETISCIFNVLSTLSKELTLIQWVDKLLTKIHKTIPKAIRTNGYMRLEMANMHDLSEPTNDVDEMTKAAQVD